jgi:NADH-quinone oxidoreductase subunit C
MTMLTTQMGVHSWPVMASVEAMPARLQALLGDAIIEIVEHVGETSVTLRRDALVESVRRLRDDPALRLNQLIDICGVDFPDRPERFEVVYQLLSMASNLRLRVKVSTDSRTPVPSLTGLFPVAGWYERETWDCYGVLFDGNPDLRRILTDYGFEGHPFRKDFPLTGHVELRYSEEHKRVVYEPVKLAQDFRSFDFLSPWEGTDYVLPGDEKAKTNG